MVVAGTGRRGVLSAPGFAFLTLSSTPSSGSFALYDMYGTAGLSDNDLYMLYGVFTQQAADRIIANTFWALMSSCE